MRLRGHLPRGSNRKSEEALCNPGCSRLETLCRMSCTWSNYINAGQETYSLILWGVISAKTSSSFYLVLKLFAW